MHYQVIFDLGDTRQALQNDPDPLMALTTGWSCPHHHWVETVEAPWGVEHKMFLALFRHSKLVKGMVQVQQRVPVTAPEGVPEFLQGGDWELGCLDRLLHAARVQVHPDLVLVPLFPGNHWVADQAPGLFLSQ